MEQSSNIREAIGDLVKVWQQVNEAASIAWAASNSLRENSDLTVTGIHLDAKVADMVDAIRQKAEFACEEIDRLTAILESEE